MPHRRTIPRPRRRRGYASRRSAALCRPAPQIYAAPLRRRPTPPRRRRLTPLRAAGRAAAPPNPGGGGFLQAIFGGPTIHVPVSHSLCPIISRAGGRNRSGRSAAATGLRAGQPPDKSSYPVDPKFDRQVVDYSGEEKPGTIIIDTPNKFLYLVEDDGKALRYGIGVGRPGFTWAGVKEITAKREWPDWTPPDDMLQRQPDLPRFMAGGSDNPLGARAMYLGSTLYRIHGSNEPWTIGTNVSSGCIRLRNDDVMDLYNRVKVGTKVVVM